MVNAGDYCFGVSFGHRPQFAQPGAVSDSNFRYRLYRHHAWCAGYFVDLSDRFRCAWRRTRATFQFATSLGVGGPCNDIQCIYRRSFSRRHRQCHESQRAASRSLGLSNSQTMRFVILPQAISRVVPPLMNDLVSLQKDVALVSLIGPIEILRQANIDKAKFANFTPYIGAAIIFLMITIPLTRTTDYLLARERKRTSATRVR